MLYVAFACVPLLIGPAARATDLACSDSDSMVVRVGPAPGSAVDWDSREVAQVRDSLTALVLSNPSDMAQKVEDTLAARYPGAVSSEELPVDYVWELRNGHWVHWCYTVTLVDVDLGQDRVVRVQVIAGKLRN